MITLARSSALLLLLASSSAIGADRSTSVQVIPVGFDPAANITITPLEATGYMTATNPERARCGSTSYDVGDFFDRLDRRRSANSKKVNATVRKEGDHFVVSVDTSEEGGRCGWTLREISAKVRVTAQATAAGPALESDLYWNLAFNYQGTPYPRVLCARPIEKTTTSNVGNIPPNGTILATTTRDDGSVWYTYEAMLPNLWCGVNNSPSGANGRAEIPVQSNSQVQLRIDLTPGAIKLP